MTRTALYTVLVALAGAGVPAQAADHCGRAVDLRTQDGVGGVWVTAHQAGAKTRQTYSDSSGSFCLDELSAGPWMLEAERLGYEPYSGTFPSASGPMVVAMRPRPLLLQGMTVAARHRDETPTAAFVEYIPVDEHRPTSLPQLLERAAGVQVRHQGGLGSFSTASIRGSTAEQVLVFVDGVPLNQALGGGVDLGSLLVGGVDRVEVYRGAVPGRFGGNSLGGVVNLHTRAPSSRPRWALTGMAGSFGTWQASLGLSGPWRGGQYLGLVEGTGSQNNFSFLDDNGTPYNPRDDEETSRRNSDYTALRTLLKAERPWGSQQVRASHTLDLRHQGIPGIGNFQARQVRFDGWQDLSQIELSGPAGGSSGYEIALYHSIEQDTYKDLRGEVGTGVQHHRNTTQGLGAQGALHLLKGAGGVVSLSSRIRAERFSPHNLFRPTTQLPASRRYSALLGAEGELVLGRLRLMAGGQGEGIGDVLAQSGGLTLLEGQSGRKSSALLSGQFAAELQVAGEVVVQGHLGRHQRPPSFYELFGDRGAVIGNTDLRRERGIHWDGGLTYAPAAPRSLRRLELAYYRKHTRDLIRFVQNSQQVSRPHNIGRALVRGFEVRAELGAGPARLQSSYTYQKALNHSPFPFETGRDLPNAPRHSLDLNGELGVGRAVLYHELNGESRQYLDRANLRSVAGRLLHTSGLRLRLGGGLETTAEVRNLGDDQVEDLWGYPLPGRSFFFTLGRNLGSGPSRVVPTPKKD